jgi:hypothetical protein
MLALSHYIRHEALDHHIGSQQRSTTVRAAADYQRLRCCAQLLYSFLDGEVLVLGAGIYSTRESTVSQLGEILGAFGAQLVALLIRSVICFPDQAHPILKIVA